MRIVKDPDTRKQEILSGALRDMIRQRSPTLQKNSVSRRDYVTDTMRQKKRYMTQLLKSMRISS